MIVRDFPVSAGLRADVVGSGQDHDDLGVDAVELTVLEAPEDVLGLVGAPSEVAGIPAPEVLPPVRQEFGIVGRAPSADDRIADEVDVDAAFGRFLEQLRVRDQ